VEPGYPVMTAAGAALLVAGGVALWQKMRKNGD
jgi:hypothetical protein